MNLCDSNVWLALALAGHGHHTRAKAWFDSLDRGSPALFCRATQQSFVRLLTNSSVLGAYGVPPLTNEKAWEVYESLLADDRIRFESREPSGLESRWKQLAARPTASPKLWMDAYLAAFAQKLGIRLVTNDRAYRQFPALDLLVLE